MAATTWNDLVQRHWAGSDAPAVVTAAGSWSGAELLARAGGAAAWLDAEGFAPGRPIPALMSASPPAIALAVGAALSNRALAPLGTRLPATDLAAAIRGLGARGIVVSPDLVAEASEAGALAGAQVHVLDGAPVPGDLPWVHCGPDDVALIVHTSGTTGAPKPVAMRHRPLVARVGIYAAAVGLEPEDRFSSASPFHHTAGVAMVFTMLASGVSVIPQAAFRLDAWPELVELGMTCALLVPTMIDMLLADGMLARAAPRVVQYGAAPMHPATLAAAMEAVPESRFVQIFGQTELSPITALSHDDHRRALDGRLDLLGTVGRPVPGAELAVEGAGEDGIGQIIVRAPHAYVVDPDGWRRTGDLGSVDDEGYVTLRGRLHDRIVRGGENIYPIEVERALLSHPGVRDVAVVGVPDRRWGEIVAAVIVATDPASPPSSDDLRAHARERIAPFKVPATVEVVDELPRNAAGKVLRHQLLG